ncbi:MAG: hypothetical protein R3B70_08710 [Polyangiaceae bacterium]
MITNTATPLITQFWTPARQIDFPNDPTKQAALNALWTSNLNGFIEQGMNGNPWNTTNTPPTTNYFNPLTFPSQPVTANSYAAIEWNALPGRISAYFPSLSSNQVYQLADTGYYDAGGGRLVTFGSIPASPCSPTPNDNVAYGPYGPRGWQDEYCEWAVTRNGQGQITRIDFTCENPEYWASLWRIDPDAVLSIYRSTLNKPQIRLEELQLKDRMGNAVIDPSTGQPVYDPFNKWNTGPVSSDTAGGAMHLTSTPNTLQTEIGLATAATVQRIQQGQPWTASTLICCAQYGQPNRNSDPNIGFNVNTLVGAGLTVSLANPPGLYIQEPNFTQYSTPDNTDASEFWTVVRGTETLTDQWGNTMPGNYILHAVFEVPASKGYTVSDISINGQKIAWGSQVAATIAMHIIAWGFGASTPAAVGCVGDTSPADTFAQPLQLFHQNVFNADYGTGVSTVNVPMSLLSNSTYVPPIVTPGATGVPMVLTAGTMQLGPNGELPAITFTLPDGSRDPNITATATASFPVTYAVPGNSYPSTSTALPITVTVAAGAAAGERGVQVTNSGQAPAPTMPALLWVGTPPSPAS